MSNQHHPTTGPRLPKVYHIRIEGHLGNQWTDWFDGLTITREDNGETLLSGPVIDQAALHGLLKKIRDLGVPLISVNRIDPRQPEDITRNKQHQAPSTTESNNEYNPLNQYPPTHPSQI